MTEQSGQSPWSPNADQAAPSGIDAPTMPTTAVSAPVGGQLPEPKKTNWLKVVVAINAVVVVIGAAVIAVVMLGGDDRGSDVAMVDDRPTTTRSSKSGESSDDDSDTPRTSSTQSDDAVELDPDAPDKDDKLAAATTVAPAPTAAPVTLAPPTTPPPTQPAVPGPDEALGQARSTLEGFMAADNRDDPDGAMEYLAPPVEQWVDPKNRPFSAAQLREDIGNPKSADVRLSLVSDPTLDYGPEPTPSGGWTIKVSYTMGATGSYVSDTGEVKCVDNNQNFLDTLVAPPGGTPLITSHVQTGSDNYC